ncbi:MAG: hypothetical protein ABSB68_09240 [Acidimicrobiales bacterium]
MLTTAHPAADAAGAVDVVVDACANVVELVATGRLVVDPCARGVGGDEPHAASSTPTVIPMAVTAHRRPVARRGPARDRGTGPA